MTLTYAEQLRHPNWQRVRLEMLEAANFKCNNCGCGEKTLHVHHRQYFKGRMAWDYGANELDVLCEECHKTTHAHLDGIKTLLSEVNAHDAFALIAGFHHHSDWVDSENRDEARNSNALVYAAGFVAWMAQHLDIGDLDRLAEYAASMMPPMSEARMVYRHNSAEIFGRQE